jgi:hypothetical protein
MKKNKEIVNITKEELIKLLVSVEKASFTQLVTETEVRMNKTGNPYNKIIKKSVGKFLIGGDYMLRVINEGKKEGIETSFETEESKLGKHISKCVLYNEKLDKHYLQCEYFTEVPPKVEYFYEGNPIEKVLFESWLTKKTESTKQPQERKVKIVSYNINNIKEISLNGNKYVL